MGSTYSARGSFLAASQGAIYGRLFAHNVDLGSSANEFAADRFVRSVELSLLSTVDSE